jgi:ribosome-binding factor A
VARATGVLRRAVGPETGIKFTPTVSFKLDAIPENAHKIDDLIAAAKASDAAVASQAAGAQYAGEPDPYKVPRPADAADDSDEEFEFAEGWAPGTAPGSNGPNPDSDS